MVAFVVHELVSEQPLINLRYVTTGNIPILALILILFRFVVLATALVVPQYLTTVQGFRALQTGDVLLWMALPQFVLAPLIANTLRYVDARIPLALGFALIGVACFMASDVTSAWQSDDFLPSQILQAIGQSFGFTSLIWFLSRHLTPRDTLTFGAFVQTMRLFGGELGVAFMQTLLRVSEQFHSHQVGLHVVAGSFLADSRLDGYDAAVASRSIGQPEAYARAMSLLSSATRTQANVLSYIDGFTVIGISTIGGLLLIALLRPLPHGSEVSS